MIFDILRFNLFALDLLKEDHSGRTEEMSIGEYLDREGYSEGFKEDYLLVSTSPNSIDGNSPSNLDSLG
jgi:predicted NAD/FAD-binding protein